MRQLIIVTDAWHPQINGVVRSIENTIRELQALGVAVSLVTPDQFRNFPCPSYPDIRLSITSRRAMHRHLSRVPGAFIHIATEGPLGLAARNWCLRHGRAFTTCFHTRFPDYVAARVPFLRDLTRSLVYRYARWFHNAGSGCMVATASLEAELAAHGFRNLMRWSRGIDQQLFAPEAKEAAPFGLPRPLFVTVGRVAVEKNLEAFLALDLPGSKMVVGDGPARAALEKKFPDVRFTGALVGRDLAHHYAQADVFVFPSRTDTFGNAIIEALASGVPVAAYPVMGPGDILAGQPAAGQVCEDLGQAALAALQCDPQAALALGRSYRWDAASRAFLDNVLAANPSARSLRLMQRLRGRGRGWLASRS